MASETPYHDCPFLVDKPLKFTGTGGTPVIDCEGKQDAFKIKVSAPKKSKRSKKVMKLVVVMSGFKIRNAKTAIFYDKMPQQTIVQILDLKFEENDIDVSMKNLDLCSLTMKNVIASGSHGDGIRLESCKNAKVQLTNCEFHGKYLDVVSTRLALTLAMFNVKFDMKIRRPNTPETRSPVHIETAVHNRTSITVSESSQFLNHAGKHHGMVAIETPPAEQISRNKSTVSVYVRFTEVNFANNSASAGNGSAFTYSYKGLKYKFARVIFEKCTFRDNSAFFKGGAQWLEKIKTVMFQDCVFSRNRAHGTAKSGSGQGRGGAMFAAQIGRLDLTNCSFHGNSASRSGGALHVLHGGSTIITGGIFGNDRDSLGVTLGDVMYVNENNMRFREKVIFDLQSANSRESMIWFRSEKAILLMDNSTQFTCPKGYHYEQLDTASIRRGQYHFFAFKCVPCHDQFYSVSRGYHVINGTDVPGKCRSCPNGASCDGTIRARQNFWGALRGDEVEMIPCPRGYCCDREPCDGYDSCASHRTGTLCGRCEDGFSEGVSSAVCHPNESCRGWYLAILMGCTLVLFAFLLFEQELITSLTKLLLWNDRETKTSEYRSEEGSIEDDEDNNMERSPILLRAENAPDCTRVPESEAYNESGGYIKSFVYFYQVVYLLGISSNASRDAFPNAVIELFMPFLNLQFGDAFTTDCVFQDVTPVAKTFFKNSVCLFLFSYCVLSYLVYLLVRYCKFPDSSPDTIPGFVPRSFPVRLTGAIMQIILLSYAALTQLTLRLLHCVKVGDHHVLQIDGSVVCYESFQGFIWLLFSVYIFSFPFVLIFGRHLLVTDQLSPRRFILACIFPTIFLLYWIYQYKFRGEFRSRPTGTRGRNHFRDKIVYILQYPYKESPADATWLDRTVTNWESVLMLRRLALVSVFIFADSFLLRSYLHFIFSFIFLLHHFFAQPFVNARANIFETISLGILMLFSGFGIAEASYIAAGEALPSLIRKTIAARDYSIALFPFVILFIFLLPRIKFHSRRCRENRSRSTSFQPLNEEV